MTYLKLFLDYLDAIEPLGDAERGRLFTALLQYARTGEAPQLSGNERFVFPMIRAQIDRDSAEYAQFVDKQRANGAKGGRPRTRPAPEGPGIFEKTQKSQDKGKDKDEGKDEGKEKDVSSPHPPSGEGGAPWGEALTHALEDWIRYKEEKRQGYKPQGLRALRAEICRSAQRYGEDAVAALIRRSMAANWQGIAFDRLSASGGRGEAAKQDDAAWMKRLLEERARREERSGKEA